MVRAYKLTADRLVETVGAERVVRDLAADDFERLRAELAEAYGPVRLGNEIQKVRTVFKYGYEAGLLNRPVRFGPDFRKPSAAVLRKHRANNGGKMYGTEEVHRLLGAASPAWRAMILLGVNARLGNTDCALLEPRHLDLEQGWLNYPRPKTGIERRAALWSETVRALREALAERPEPRSEAASRFVFLNSYGRPWARDGEVDSKNKASSPVNSVARGFGKVSKAAGVQRKGCGFYALRHVFRTIADGCGDQPAVNYVMGHSDTSMADVYRERIDDARLRAVAEHVRQWLYGTQDDAPDGGEQPRGTASGRRRPGASAAR